MLWAWGWVASGIQMKTLQRGCQQGRDSSSCCLPWGVGLGP